jgi:hypothetical protein
LEDRVRHVRDRAPYQLVEPDGLDRAALRALRAMPFPDEIQVRPRRPVRLLRSMLALLAVVVAFAAAGTASADGTEEETPQPQAELTQENLSTADAGVDNTSDASQVAEQEIASDDPAPEGEDESGASSESQSGDAAEEPAQTQASGAESTASQQAGAVAEASQDAAANTNVTVAVGQEGDHPSVNQGNQASAGAQAGTVASVPASASQAQQSASANAAANQTNPANTNVAVLVGSPGDLGPVSQGNSASAAAGAATSADLPEAAQSGQAQAAAAQDGASNTNVSIRVDSPGTNGAVTQENAVGADASATTTSPDGTASASASASQSGAHNANVSIRLDSPGEDEPVSQSNSSETTTLEQTGELVEQSVEVSSSGTNLDVDLDLAGDAAEVPTTWVWTWSWVWDGDEELDWDALWEEVANDLATGDWDWNWSWGAEPDAESQDAGVTSDASPDADSADSAESQQAGTWTWAWDWDVDLEGWDWDWFWNGAAPCECTWTWDWNWSWQDLEPAPESSDPSETGSEVAAGIEQTNDVVADASAQADLSIEQEIDQTQSGASEQTQEAYQVAEVAQTVSAAAAAVQADAENVAISLDVSSDGGSVAQLNTAQAASDAVAHSASFQLIVQEQEGEGSEQMQWAGQVVEVLQTASAQSVADQSEVWNWNSSSGTQIAQVNAADGSATAVVTSELTQVIGQGQTGDGSLQSQDAGQLATILQDHAALSSATQSHATNWNLSLGGDFDQTNASLADADSQAASTGFQDILQIAAGDGSIDLQEAWQILEVVQGGIAVAVATQSYVGNENTYFAPQGPEQPAPAPTRGSSAHAYVVGGSLPVVEALEPASAAEPAALQASMTLVVAGELHGTGTLELPSTEEPGGGVAGSTYQVSASPAGEPGASATREGSTGDHMVVDAEPAEALPPLPAFAPSESGAITGATGGTASSGPSATATRLVIEAPHTSFPALSPTVRRSAVFLLAGERPG